jgi:hypothetical protein
LRADCKFVNFLVFQGGEAVTEGSFELYPKLKVSFSPLSNCAQ